MRAVLCMYMATVSGDRCNPTIREFWVRLKNAGNQDASRSLACMRKLLTILNAMLRNRTLRDRDYRRRSLNWLKPENAGRGGRPFGRP